VYVAAEGLPRGVLIDETAWTRPMASLMDKIRKWLGDGEKELRVLTSRTA